MQRIYLDYNATTPLRPAVLEAMTRTLRDCGGNPSSVHWHGREARKAVDDARQQVAVLLRAKPSEVVFTGSGSEADFLAIVGAAETRHKGKDHLVTVKTEHPAVLKAARRLERRGVKVTFLDVDREGLVEPSAVRRAVTQETFLVSVMMAQNETGTIQRIHDIAEALRATGILFHTDAVQAAGKVPVDPNALGVDMLSLAAHKFFGPKGVGLLWVREGIDLAPVIEGGGQEHGLRSGTENVAGIVGLATALEVAVTNLSAWGPRMAALRKDLLVRLRAAIPDLVVNGQLDGGLPNTANVSIPGAPADQMVVNLDLEGISVSAGSACHSGAIEPSAVLSAMGVPREAAVSAIRLSLAPETTEGEVSRVAETIARVAARFRGRLASGVAS